ncbi:MAG: hypothetical protein IJI65_10910 [Lachnospiraceae bacterium]|nr:hypothetical protein [Lachnospiraceae bacterium]
MTDILFENDHILIRSEYRTPDIHRHLASHIAFGIKSDLTCVVGEDTFRCRGVIIASDIEHTIFAEAGDMLLFLLDTTSERARFVQKNYLCEKEYSLLDAATVRQMSSIWEKCMDDLKLADKRLLTVLGIDGSKEVVAWSVFPCFQDILVSMQPKNVQKAFHILMKLHARALLNFVFGKKAKKSPVIDWGIRHGCYAYEAKDAYSYAKKLKLYDLAPIADRITQDMLILGANEDHFIDYKLIGREINMLKNVRSLTFRLFTDKEDAQNHCNVGNGKLALDTICNWIESTDRK